MRTMSTETISIRFSIVGIGVAACLALAACSGGESGGGVASVAAPITGTFVDSPVNGLHYTALPSNPAGGVTANGGQYQCVAGDTVTFDLGGRVIGTGQPCGELVTVVSVFGATSVTDLRVRNLAQLLLTLGGIPADSQPIELPASIPATLPAHLDFSDPQFEQMLQTALSGRPLVSQDQVAAHLSASFKTVTVTGVTSGMVTSIPAGLVCTGGTCSYDFVRGTRVTLAAVGTGFTGWNGDGCTGAGTCQILLTATQVVRAVFLAPPPPATLTINPNPGTGTGQVQCSTGGAFGPCAASYSSGTALTLRGVANSGSTFAGWSNGTGNISCTGIANCSITITANSSVTATFTLTITNFSVTATVATTNGGGGTVQCSANGGEPGVCSSYLVGSTIVMTAMPNAASNFTGWTGASCSGTGTCTFTLTANTAVTAHFNRPVLTVQVNGTGSVSSNPTGINSCTSSCTASFSRGTSITLTATGSGFSGWSGGCSGTGSCALNNLQGNTSVTAAFGTVSSSPWYEFVRDVGGGPLLVINPATPTITPATLVATQRDTGHVYSGTYANNVITNLATPALVYISAGRIWKVNANRFSNDLPGTGNNLPIQISSESVADNVCPDRLITVPDVTTINNTRIVYELPGSDNNCDTRADNVTKLVRFGDNSTVAPISLQPGRVWGSEGGNLGVFNLTNGSTSHIFFVDLANANTLLIMNLATNALTTIQANVGFSRIVALDTSDRIFLLSSNTTLSLYTISTNTLTTLVSATAGSSLRRGQDFTADSTHLYLLDVNPGVVKKVPLTATGSGNVLNHYTAPAPVSGMYLTENRLVLRVGSNPCNQSNSGSEGLISVRKDNNTVVSTLIPIAAETCITSVWLSGSNIFYDKIVSDTERTAGILSEDGTTVVSPISNGRWAGDTRTSIVNVRSNESIHGRMFLLTSPTSESVNGGTLSVYDTATPVGQPLVGGVVPSTTNQLFYVRFAGLTSTAMGVGFSQSTTNTEVFFVDTDIPNSLVRVPVPSPAQWFFTN